MPVNSTGQTILAFGYHDCRDARNWVIERGLTKLGFSIVQCHTEKKGFLPKNIDLWKKYRKIYRQTDYMLLPFLGHYLVPLAWVLTRFPRKPLIFDAFISLYDTYVHDRKLISKWSPHAWILFCIDGLSCSLADIVLIDTTEHKNYFVRTFKIKSEKILVLPIRSRTEHLQQTEGR